MIAIAVSGLLPPVVIAVAAWLASLPLRDASTADRVWPWLVAAPVASYAWLLGAPSARAACMAALLLLWSVRLCAYITWRNWGHGEDRRYAAMRAEHGAAFPMRSLATVFLLQGVLGWLVSWPLLAGWEGQRPIGVVDLAGGALALFGIVFEAVADAQLARFRADPAQHGQVLREGLWRWSRHPNYFGEACTWWGLGLMGLSALGPAGAWCLASPLLMTVLLLRVSGVSLLERDIADRRPGYRDYVQRTSAFFPRPPRKQA
jgi:steroid 5-alpha reductase family enzyme